MADYDYDEAFSRTIGWITPAERDVLKTCRVAVAGLGGVGGSHVTTLARLGLQQFNLADMDAFALVNMNRQAGAFLSTLGKSKLDVVSATARDINPGIDIRGFAEGVTPENLDAFLEDVDVYIDGLDFFEIEMRRAVFAACRRRAIPAITAAPLGMGAGLLVFLPEGMSFEDYFRLEGCTYEEQLLRFLIGLAPRALHQRYLVEPSAVRLSEHRGPSTPMACEMCAAMASTTVLKLLLQRGPVAAAPHGLQFDAYRQRLVHTWRPGGNRHPMQRLILALARRRFMRAVR